MIQLGKTLCGVAGGTAAIAFLCAAAPPTPAVSVVALYRERMLLPEPAVLRVTLTDASASRSERYAIATTTMLNPRVPVSLRLAYEPSTIDANHTYVVTARITVNGEVWFATESATKVITHNCPTHVELLMKRVTEGSPQNVEDRRWALSELGGRTIAGENRPYIELRAGHLSGSGGCNRIAGNYKIEGESLAFSPMASTMMMCIQKNVMENESGFFKALERVHYWSVKGEYLELLDAEHKTVMLLESEK